MAITATELWQRIASTRLATSAECRQWAADLANDVGSAGITDPAAILAHLIRAKRVTPYQANGLMEERPPTLGFGSCRVLGELKEPPFQGWLEGVDVPTGRKRFLFQLDPSKIQKNASWLKYPPSLALARKHAAVESPWLLNFDSPIQQLPEAVVVVRDVGLGPLPCDGMKPIVPWERCSLWIEHVAKGLSALHRGGLVHGRIQSAMVGLSRDNACLLRDPLFYPQSPLLGQTPSCLGSMKKGVLEPGVAFAAPEFLVPGHQPNVASDLYALGCLWYQWLTGTPPFVAQSSDDCMAAHVQSPIAFPDTLDFPARLKRLLQHLCAKNPNARFRTIDEFLAALRGESKPAELPASTEVARGSNQPIAPPMSIQPEVGSIVQPQSLPKSVTNDSSTIASEKGRSRQQKAPIKPSPSPKIDPTQAPASAPIQATVVVQPTPSHPTPASAAPQSPPTSPVSAPPSLSQPSPPQPLPPPSPPTSPRLPSAPPMPPATSSLSRSGRELEAESIPKSDSRQSLSLPSMPPRPISSVRGASTMRKRTKKASRPAWLMPVIGSGLFLGVVGLLFFLSRGRDIGQKDRKQEQNQLGNGSETTNAVTKADPVAEQYQIQADDGQYAWAPPSPIEPYRVDYFAPGLQAILFLRPERWIQTEVGRSVLELLDEPIAQVRKPFENAIGLPVNEVREIAIAMYPGEAGWPNYVVRIELNQSRPLSELTKGWGSPMATSKGDQCTLFDGSDRSFFIREKNSEGTSIQRFAFGPKKLIDEVAELEGGAIALRRQMEALIQVSDSTSDLTLVLAPSFFNQEGKQILATYAPRLEKSIKEILTADVAGAMVAMQIEPRWYGEIRLMGNAEKETLVASRNLKDRIHSLSSDAEAMMVSQPAHPYWRAVAIRLPQMLRAIADYQRTGVENGYAISNFYLPKEALPNLALATWMSMQYLDAHQEVRPNGAQSMSGSSSAKTIDELLARPIDLSFDQQSLETAMNSISEEINAGLEEGSRVTFEIDGGAFERDGITRNKEVRDFRFKQQPGRSAINELAKKANPEATESLQVPNQKVVWVILDDEKRPGKKKVQFTTRKAAEAIQATLPKEFVASP